MRKFASQADHEVRQLLESLLASSHDVDAYRGAMQRLGVRLGEWVASTASSRGRVCIVSSVEDADFLMRGFLDGIRERWDESDVHVVVYWNERQPEYDLATIVHRYEERFEASEVSTVVVLKSIVSGGCTVATNLIDLLTRAKPEFVYVAAPVAYSGAREYLRNVFTPEVEGAFRYSVFAVDDQRSPTGEVVPGVGGSVYELLGVGDATTKNQYRPQILKTRRKALLAASAV
ncbi:MAG: hypothetical protein H0U69_14255 [Trueperaceae bacterium]|nr:hypothetical protein [Trueperaceae bacterium]